MNVNNKLLLLALAGAITQSVCTAAFADDGKKDFILPEIKDIIVEQQDIYTISPGSGDNYSSNSAGSHPVSVTIWVNHSNNTYAIGDQVVIHAKAKRDGYLTLLDVGTSGKIRQLFPNKHQQNNYLKKGDVIRIPAKRANFRYMVTGPTGKELIKAFMTTRQGSIYGRSADTFNDDIYPLTSLSSKALRKDIVTELNTTHQGSWGEYSKVITIVSASPQQQTSNLSLSPSNMPAAMQAERALKLNRAQLRDIQRYLRQTGYYNGSIDGVIGKRTRQAVAALQRAVNLPVSGYIDTATFTHIMDNQ